MVLFIPVKKGLATVKNVHILLMIITRKYIINNAYQQEIWMFLSAHRQHQLPCSALGNENTLEKQHKNHISQFLSIPEYITKPTPPIPRSPKNTNHYKFLSVLTHSIFLQFYSSHFSLPLLRLK